jgi:hypothetical protein
MDVTFALPTTTVGDNAERDRLNTLLRTQALAVIIAAYLDHAAQVNQSNPNEAFRFTRAELVTLINDVQGALL